MKKKGGEALSNFFLDSQGNQIFDHPKSIFGNFRGGGATI